MIQHQNPFTGFGAGPSHAARGEDDQRHSYGESGKVAQRVQTDQSPVRRAFDGGRKTFFDIGTSTAAPSHKRWEMSYSPMFGQDLALLKLLSAPADRVA